MKKTTVTINRKPVPGKENVMVKNQAQIAGGATEASGSHSCMS